MSRNKKNINTNYEFNFSDYMITFFLSIILGIIPLIVKLKVVETTDLERIFGRENEIFDFFAYYKSYALVAISVILAFFFLFEFLSTEKDYDFNFIKKDPIFIASIAFILMAILSTIFSPYKQISLKGVAERYESIYVLISYFVVFLTVKSYIKTEKHRKMILIILSLSAIVIGIIGVSQYLGHDFFTTSFARKLIVSKKLRDELGELTGKFTTVYGTLYNPNCVGAYSALMFPVLFITGIFYPKKSYLKYILLCSSALVFVSLVGCNSMGGFLGFAASLAVLGITVFSYFIVKKYKEKSKRILSFTALGLLIFVLISSFIFKDKLYIIANKALKLDQRIENFVNDLTVAGDTATISTVAGKILLKTSDSNKGFVISDENNNLIEPTYSDIVAETNANRMMYDIPGMGQVQLQTKDSIAFIVINGVNFVFAKLENGNITALSETFYPIDINAEVRTFGFEGIEHLGSSRGYIWSRTLPLISENIILGKGPDTFLVSFPQHDLVGKLREWNDAYIVVDKPHNFYLQTIVNTGLISLLILLFIFGYYIFDSLKSILFSKSDDKYCFVYSLAILTGVCGYLVAVLGTDSAVSVSPIFWGVLGLGFGVNKLLRKYGEQGANV